MPDPAHPLLLLQLDRDDPQGRVRLPQGARVDRSQLQQDRVPRRGHVQRKREVAKHRVEQQSHPLHRRRVREAARASRALFGREQHSGNPGGRVRRQREPRSCLPSTERHQKDRREGADRSQPIGPITPEQQLHREGAARIPRALREPFLLVPGREQDPRASTGHVPKAAPTQGAAVAGQ